MLRHVVLLKFLDEVPAEEIDAIADALRELPRVIESVRDYTIGRDLGISDGASDLVAIGGFDEGYFMYFEDVDLGYRLGKAGYRNRYEPGVAVTHVGGHTAARDSAVMIRAHHTSARRFITRKYAGWHLWPVRVALSAGLAVRSALLQRRAQ